MHKPFIDYSQLDTFSGCELRWWERYRSQYTKAPKLGQKNDPRVFGSITHAALDNFRVMGTPTVSADTMARYDPTPECLQEALQLAAGYVATYPNEEFTKYYCEEPLKFPLHERMDGLAKIDSYFNLAEPVSIEDGLGDRFTLEPGWWIHEYKTKAASKDVGKYVGSWRMNMQPAFQCFALAELVGEKVKGVLVNVLEKPQEYTPKRTCKACRTQIPLRDWQPTGDGYRCPDCQNVQDIDTQDKTKTVRAPKYYRIMIQRTLAELERARVDMLRVVERMLAMDQAYAETGDPQALRRTSACIDQIWGECEYYGPHSALQSAAGYPGFVPIEALEYVTK